MHTAPPTLAAALSRFGGSRALLVDGSGQPRYPALIAGQFRNVDLLAALPASAASAQLSLALPGVTRSAWDGLEFPFEDGVFDAVFFVHALSRFADWPPLIEQGLRVLQAGSPLVVIEYSSQVGTPQQSATLALERLMRDRDSAFFDQTLPWLTESDFQRALRHAAVNALHCRELPFDASKPSPAEKQRLKHESLDRIQQDLLPSLSRLGGKRGELEVRLTELQKQIEATGTAPLNYLLVSMIKAAD